AERVDVLEAAVHRRESHVRDLVEIVQLLHRQLADQPRVHFALAERAQFVADVHDRGIERFARHRALLQRLEHAIAELAFVERLAAGVVLDDARHHQLGRLEGRETLAALQALATAADLLSFAGQARVDDFGFLVVAEGAMHGKWRGSRGSRESRYYVTFVTLVTLVTPRRPGTSDRSRSLSPSPWRSPPRSGSRRAGRQSSWRAPAPRLP